MDVAKPDTPASVYALTTENQQKPQRIFQGKLSEVNTPVAESDRRTTSRTRAVSFVASLCKHWGIKYKPQLGSASRSQSGSEKACSNVLTFVAS